MIRAGAVVVVLAALVSVGGMSGAQTQDLLVANNSEIAFIDADNDGNRSADDCYFGATMMADGSALMINGTQNEGPNKLRACEGPCYGNAFASSDFAEVAISNCVFSGVPFVPMFADFCESSSCDSALDDATAPAAGRAAGLAPLALRSGAIFRTEFGLELAGAGVVCSAGGPAAQITDDSGNTVLRELTPFPDSQDPTHMCAANIPVQLASGPVVLRMGCFPVADGVSAFALSGSPDMPVALIDFENLPGCSGRASRAPTASEWSLIGLIASLLVGGTWLLARRPRFADSLPLA
jgi:hypothetical protein